MEVDLRLMFKEGRREIVDVIDEQIREVFLTIPSLTANGLFAEGSKILGALQRLYLSEAPRRDASANTDRIGSNPFLTEVRQVYLESQGKYNDDAFFTSFVSHELETLRSKHKANEPYTHDQPNWNALSWSDDEIIRWLGGAIGLDEFRGDKSLLFMVHNIGGFPLPEKLETAKPKGKKGSSSISSTYPTILVFYEMLNQIYAMQEISDFRPDKSAVGEFIAALRGSAETLRQNMSPLWQDHDTKLFTKADYTSAEDLMLKLGIPSSNEFKRAKERAPIKRTVR